MSSAPGMAPPPGVQQPSVATQANRPSGLPPSLPPPANLPNINFNAPVIRLGSSSLPPKPGAPTGPGGRKDPDTPVSAGPGRSGQGQDRGLEQARANLRESMQSLAPPTNEEKLRTIFIHKIPEGVGGEEGIEKLLRTVGRLRRWDGGKSHLQDHKGELFGFAQFEDPDSLATAVELLRDVEVPLKKQDAKTARPDGDGDDSSDDIEKVQLQVSVDPSTLKYLEAYRENRAGGGSGSGSGGGGDGDGDGDGDGKDGGEEAEAAPADPRLEAARSALQAHLRELFRPQLEAARDGDGDVAMGGGTGAAATAGDSVEVVNITLAPDDELADIPAEMREVVAAEIASFRERSNRRDLERLRREEEMEEMERQRGGFQRASRLDTPPPGARGVPNAPSGPRGSGPGGGGGRGSVAFVNGGTNGDLQHEDDDTDASDDELHRRELARQKADEDKLYLEAERKWVNRERQRAAALERERDRDRTEADGASRLKEEHYERDRSWDDDRESSRKAHVYYRDHANWIRKRTQDRADEEARDEADRRAEADEHRRQAAEMEAVRGMADSFLERQAQEMEQRQPAAAAAAAAPQRFTISFGAAAQKAQAQRAAPSRRTMAEVEGLLDDEEQDSTAKRQLIPIKFEPSTAASAMSEEEISQAVRALAQEIPTEKDGLWAWDVKWDYMDEAIIRDKLRPFVEKKVVEYLGVQEQFLVEVVEEHLRKHGKPGELVDELAEALDDAAEDLVKKLWRMVIFFTESEKRGLPA